MSYSVHTDDFELLAGLRAGSHAAFNCIFKKYYGGICAYASRFVGPEEVEDIADDCMVRLWERRENLVIESSFRKYLFTMVYHRASNAAIRNKVAAEAAGRIAEMRHAGEMDERDFLTESELRERIRLAIGALPQTYRDTFLMHRFEGKTYKEIAAIYGISPKTVDYRIQQSLKLLRKYLEAYLPLVAVAVLMGYLATAPEHSANSRASSASDQSYCSVKV